MRSERLTEQAWRENARTLADALGIAEEEAGQLLEIEVVLRYSPNDRRSKSFASEIGALLERTVAEVWLVPGHVTATVDVVILAPHQERSGLQLYLDLCEECLSITEVAPHVESPTTTAHPLLVLFSACYSAAAVIHKALPSGLPTSVPIPFFLEFDQIVSSEILSRPIHLDHAYLAGAGAVANGLLWALRHLDVHGELNVCDDDQVDSGNLNRQIWFGVEDIDEFKAVSLVDKAQPYFPTLKLVSRINLLQDLEEKHSNPHWLRRLIVAVDSRRARRTLQEEFPGEVFDASTTDITEVVLHYHKQPTDHACMSCIYEEDTEEFSRETHIAEHLGLEVEQVREARISETAASKIAERFPDEVDVHSIMGMSYDSLFRSLCSQGRLLTPEGKQLLAPFCFVSVLAGTMLAIELAKRLNGYGESYNYWKISPWHPPLSRLRRRMSARVGCVFCKNKLFKRISHELWVLDAGGRHTLISGP
jgi:ThiF family/E1 N-terminal domain